ncbi:MAG: ImmA/IrrE family metallo-endopeptidase [bacterium]|nr:ImmA/IrrE family metallo-endopeptidase [bacterium]
MTSIKANPISRIEIRKIAYIIRAIADTLNSPYFPIIYFIEHTLPRDMPEFNYEIVNLQDMPHNHAETHPDQNLIQIREDVYLRAIKGCGRDRFTLAHELGHLLLHRANCISLCRLAPNKRLKPYENPEWQANAFAGELLMPIDIIKDMSIYQICHQCGVSADAARCQLSLLKNAR